MSKTINLGPLKLSWTTLLASLFFLTTSVRAMLVSVIPLQALELLGSASGVSLMYFGVAAVGIAATISIPRFVSRHGAHRVFVFGAIAGTISPMFLWFVSIPTLFIGMLLQVTAIACLEVSTSLYVMQGVPRKQLSHFEPIRLVFSGSAFIVGPWAGVYLETQIAHWVPFALTSALSTTAYVYWRYLSLHKMPMKSDSGKPKSPGHFLMRYIKQPRLRLAWVLAFSRNGWWGVFFVYAPIYAVTVGLSEVTAGAIVSIGVASILIVPFWGWVGRRYGLRPLLVYGFIAMGIATPLVILAKGSPLLTAALLIFSGFIAVIADGSGHVCFYRAVRSFERSEMTSVYLTYRDVSQLIPPGVFSVLLIFFPLTSVYLVTSSWMFVIAYFARYLPRRM
ncbi:MAG: MFS transporter [Gammaproteobacteria bacterium]|nr:MFS transporter [Gammaproteobacteria bacterium]